MKNLASGFALILLISLIGCDANLTEPTDTSALDQIASAAPNPNQFEELLCSNPSNGKIRESDGSWMDQHWKQSPFWDPTIQHASFDQDIYFKGVCSITEGCQFTSPSWLTTGHFSQTAFLAPSAV